MKTQIRLMLLMSLILVSVAGMAGCAGSAAQPPATEEPATQAPPTEPPVQPSPTPLSNRQIVLDLAERVNAGDVEGSLAHFADDAVLYIVGLPPTGIEVYRGKEEIRAFWEDNVANHFQWGVSVAGASGNGVRALVKTWHDFTRELGVAPLEWVDVYEVKGGRITSYAGTITEGSLAKLRPALAEVMPPEPTSSEPSYEEAVSELAVTIAQGTCTAAGPMALKAGEIQVTLDVQDQDKEHYALGLTKLDAGKDQLDLMARLAVSDLPYWATELLLADLGPGQSATYNLTVEDGLVYGVCLSKPPDFVIGALGPFEVVPATPEPTPTPELVKSAVTDLQYLVGTWERSDEGAIQFDADGTYLVSETVAGIASGQASHGECWFEGSLLIFADQDGSGDGSYAVELRRTVDGDPVSIKFRAVDDPFFDRRETLNSVWAWVAP